MFKSIAVRLSQGAQYIKDPRLANPAGFRASPVIGAQACEAGCAACVAACPTEAITAEPELQIDLGRCVMCGDCAPACGTLATCSVRPSRIARINRAKA